MRKRIYISGPMTLGDWRANIIEAEAAARSLMRRGYAVLCPHLTGLMDGHEDFTHEEWMANDLPWVQVAEAVLRLPGESVGGDMETAHASLHGVPVFFSLDELEAFFNGEEV